MVKHRHTIFALLANLAFACLVLAPFGCGNPDAAAPAASSIPKPQPGAPPSSRPQVVLRFINQSSVPPAEFSDAVAKINAQLILDLNPRWGCNGAAAVWTGGFDDTIPSVVLQSRADGPGGYTQSGCGYVAYRENTRVTWRAYLSHVAINLITTDAFLAGQSVEAYDYHVTVDGLYEESAPWELADFEFPSGPSFRQGGTYYDCHGNAAHDLLSRLPYP